MTPRTVLITGCSTGIGRACAERLARSGHTVYATARRLDSIEDLAAAGCRTLGERCVKGITANRDRARRFVDESTAIVTALTPILGYARSTEIAQEALRTGRLVRDLVLEKGLLTPAQMDELLQPERLTWQSGCG